MMFSENRYPLFRIVLWSYRLDAQCARLRGGVAVRDLPPGHGIPPCLEVIRPAVLVAEIISVLPHIIAKQRALAVHDRRGLVRAGLNVELAVLCHGCD